MAEARHKTSWGQSLPVKAKPSIDSDVTTGAIFGYLSLQSSGGAEAWLLDEEADLASAAAHAVDKQTRETAVRTARSAGLEVLAESAVGLAVVGTRWEWERLHGGKTVMQHALLHQGGQVAYVTQADVVSTGDGRKLHPDPGLGAMPDKAHGVGAMGFDLPRATLATIAAAPALPKQFHLRVPGDVALLTGAYRAHEAGFTGKGVTVAMVDTGHFAHPFFAAQGYDVEPCVTVVPGTGPTRDPVGHGTAESANIFAVAPGVTLRPYRVASDTGVLVATLAGFMRAKADRPPGEPYVISCSWGAGFTGPLPERPRGIDRAFALEIADAIEQEIVVVFAAGNGAHSIEPQVPGVISAGGAYVNEHLEAIVSNFATAYESLWQQLTVPTVCGLVGMLPRAKYILLPVPPSCPMDVELARTDPLTGDPGDTTKEYDGWALLSGTSAAAPQVAGAAAILLEANRDLRPDQVADFLRRGATDLVAGTPNPRFVYGAGPADVGPNVASGFGLINVGASLELVRPELA